MRFTKIIPIYLILILTSCQQVSQIGLESNTVIITDNNKTSTVQTNKMIVKDVLLESNIELGPLDIISPDQSSKLTDGIEIIIMRVKEEVQNETIIVPFEKQILKNDNLPFNESRLLQTGKNGMEEITYRIVITNDEISSKTIVRRTTLEQPIDEIIMVGSEITYTIVPIEGSLAYISAGNAWVMNKSSGIRKPITTESSLDERIFQLSNTSEHLLYSSTPKNQADHEKKFNKLWVVNTNHSNTVSHDLYIDNVLWAAWSPVDNLTFAYSTGEPRQTAPGWQAYNDLHTATLNPNDMSITHTTILEPSAGGSYGWYGMNFEWSPNGKSIAYAQADTIGTINIIDPEKPIINELSEFSHYQTWSDWVWIPSLTWSPDSSVIYTIDHGDPIGLELPEDSQIFNIKAISLDYSFDATIAERTGIWSNPVVSKSVENRYNLAFLQANNPLQSVNSGYTLYMMEQDGSNSKPIFPDKGATPLKAQDVVWSPNNDQIALIYKGNLWIIGTNSKMSQQLTSDGQTSKPSWSQ